MLVRFAAFVAILAAAAPGSSGDSFVVDAEKSIFAVITQRGGIAARMAHDHLITADGYRATVDVTDGSVTNFTFKCETNKLQVDDPALKDLWGGTFQDAGVLAAPFKAISTGDRDTVREHMLDTDQLNVTQYPNIEATVTSVSERENTFKGETYSHVATLEITVCGKTVTRDIAAKITAEDDTVAVLAVAAFRFSEFDIKPYSALFGAVKNLDEFFLYCSFYAERELETHGQETP